VAFRGIEPISRNVERLIRFLWLFKEDLEQEETALRAMRSPRSSSQPNHSPSNPANRLPEYLGSRPLLWADAYF
jgi:hypothetical protein